jgi:hypothetical protein
MTDLRRASSIPVFTDNKTVPIGLLFLVRQSMIVFFSLSIIGDNEDRDDVLCGGMAGELAYGHFFFPNRPFFFRWLDLRLG